MADTNLSTSISGIRTRLLNDIPTATVDELLALARAAKSVGLTEDTDIEAAIDSRAQTLSSGATTDEVIKLSQALKQVRNTSQSALSPSVTSDDILEGISNKYMSDANLQSLGSAIIPATNETLDLGSATNKFRDLYLSSNTLYLGETTFSSDDILNFDLSVTPETLEIQVDDPTAGHGTAWQWTWTQSALPFARLAITNSPQTVVPLYLEGTYQINNFAHTVHGSMTQRHDFKLKWIEGAGDDNLVPWVTTSIVNDSHPDINGGTAQDVQRLAVSVPSSITLPTLVAPSVSYDVTSTTGAYVFSGTASGNNPEIGPFYRGGTYTVNINAAGHPFYFTTDNGTNFSAGTYFGEWTSGVTGSRNETGTITFVVPSNAPDILYYQCGNHSNMRGIIRVKDLAVETNANGNYLIYGQHNQEGHVQTIELRPLPTLTSQMCLVYDSSTNKFVPQDLATYVENTPSFENKIKEVAGTATLIAPDGTSLVASVNIYSDATYLPAVGNTVGDIAFVEDTQKLYIYKTTGWIETVANADLTGLATETYVQNYVANNVSGGNVVEYTSTNTAAVNDVVMLNTDGTVTVVEPTNYPFIANKGENYITSAGTENNASGESAIVGGSSTPDKYFTMWVESNGWNGCIQINNSGTFSYGTEYLFSDYNAANGTRGLSTTQGEEPYILFSSVDPDRILVIGKSTSATGHQVMSLQGTVSGTAVTWDGTYITHPDYNTEGYSSGSQRFQYDYAGSTPGTTDKFIMEYSDASGNKKLVRIEWDGTTLTYGDPVDVTGKSGFSFDHNTEGKFIAKDGTTSIVAGIVDWDTQTATFGGSFNLNSIATAVGIDPISGNAVAAYRVNLSFYPNSNSYLRQFSIDSNHTLTSVGSTVTWDTTANSYNGTPYDLKFAKKSSTFMVSYDDKSNYTLESFYEIWDVNGTSITNTAGAVQTSGWSHSSVPLQFDNPHQSGQFSISWKNRRYDSGNYRHEYRVKHLQFPYGESNLDASKVHGIAATAGTTIDVTLEFGIHTGLSGLTTGSTYYVIDNGTLATAPDSKNAKLGVAINATSLALDFTDELTSADLGTYATKSYVGQQITAAGSYSDASVDLHLNQSTATSNEVLSWNGTDYEWVAQPTDNNQLANGAGYITAADIPNTNIVEYTSTSSASVNDVVMLNTDGTVTPVEVATSPEQLTNQGYNGSYQQLLPNNEGYTISNTNGLVAAHVGYWLFPTQTDNKYISVAFDEAPGSIFEMKIVSAEYNSSTETWTYGTEYQDLASLGNSLGLATSDNPYVIGSPDNPDKFLILGPKKNGGSSDLIIHAVGTMGGVGITWSDTGTNSSNSGPTYNSRLDHINWYYDHAGSTAGSYKIIGAYRDNSSNCRIFRVTWDGNATIQYSDDFAIPHPIDSRSLDFSKLTEGRFAGVDASGNLRIGDIDWGTGNITVGTAYGLTSFNTNFGTDAPAHVAWRDSSEHFVVAWSVGGGSNSLKLRAFSTTGNSAVAEGSEYSLGYNQGGTYGHLSGNMAFYKNSNMFALTNAGYYYLNNTSNSKDGSFITHFSVNSSLNIVIGTSRVTHGNNSYAKNTGFGYPGKIQMDPFRSAKGSISAPGNTNATSLVVKLFAQPTQGVYTESNLDASKIHGIAASAGTTIDVTVEGGIHTGLSGLTAGSKYYVLSDGSLSATPDTNNAKVGLAMSSTTLAVDLLDELTDASLATYATKAYVDTSVANLVDSAPATLDTLNELAAALGDDANFSTTITNSLANKLEASDLNGYATETYVNNQITAAGSYSDASVDLHLNQSTATTDQMLVWDGSDYAWSTPAEKINIEGGFADMDATNDQGQSQNINLLSSEGSLHINETDTFDINGNLMYAAGTAIRFQAEMFGSGIYYTLATPWDTSSTWTHVGSSYIRPSTSGNYYGSASTDAKPTTYRISYDGIKAFVLDRQDTQNNSSGAIYTYSGSGFNNIIRPPNDGVSGNAWYQPFNTYTTNEFPLWDFRFSQDGTKIYLTFQSNTGNSDPNEIQRFDLTTAWDLSTASASAVQTLATPTTGHSGARFAISPDGKTGAFIKNGVDIVYYTTFSTAFDLTTASSWSQWPASIHGGNGPADIFFKPDGTKLYIMSDKGSYGGRIFQYDIPVSDFAAVATSGNYNDLSNTPSLATVATSGSYNDLTNTPTIPTNNNQLTNGAGYITASDVPNPSVVEYTSTNTAAVNDVVMLNTDGTVTVVEPTNYPFVRVSANNAQMTSGFGGASSYVGTIAHHSTREKAMLLFPGGTGHSDNNMLVPFIKSGSTISAGTAFASGNHLSIRDPHAFFGPAGTYEDTFIYLAASSNGNSILKVGTITGTTVNGLSNLSGGNGSVSIGHSGNRCLFYHGGFSGDVLTLYAKFPNSNNKAALRKFTYDFATETFDTSYPEIETSSSEVFEWEHTAVDPATPTRIAVYRQEGSGATRKGIIKFATVDWDIGTIVLGPQTDLFTRSGTHSVGASEIQNHQEFHPTNGLLATVTTTPADGGGDAPYRLKMALYSADANLNVTNVSGNITIQGGANVQVGKVRGNICWTKGSNTGSSPNAPTLIIPWWNTNDTYPVTRYYHFDNSGNLVSSNDSQINGPDDFPQNINKWIYSSPFNDGDTAAYTLASNYPEVVMTQGAYGESNFDATKLHGVAASAGTTIDVTLEYGIHTGLSGLTTGTKYFVTDGGGISTSGVAKLGTAINATSLALDFADELTSADLGTYATKAYVASQIPSLTGYATETYVDTSVANLVDSAPATLDTLNELAAALGDDPNFATTITNQIASKANAYSTVTVTASGGYFYIDGIQQATLSFEPGRTYRFDQSDASNGSHPLRFSTTSDGTHASGVEYTVGVTTNGTAGSAGAYTEIAITHATPDLYYYCTNHSGMGAGSVVGNFSGSYSDLTGTPTPYSDSMVDTHLNQSSASTGQVLSWNGSDYSWADVAGGATTSDTAPTSPSAGEFWFKSDSADLYLYYTDADSSQWIQVGGAAASTTTGSSSSSSTTPFTKFYLSASQPGSTVSSSGYLGQNVGTWYEATFANAANTAGLSPDSSDRDPTLTGITFSGDKFSGFVQNGTYEISVQPEVYERNSTAGQRYHGWEASTGAFSSAGWLSPGTGSFNINGVTVPDSIIVTFEDATPANNWVRYILESDQSGDYWIGQAILTIKKIG